ncbi:5-cytosine rRNA methyltransferase NSUN4 [Chanos chanos]|uniref:5-cytosine rRNA methyltransferase NSUN4 n=1 Tax=Chanos chanos TaxID=29144 RepID=A0A6J2VFC1_CHACN|nr:5-methylcytosine rRNA methyltransferase NSUN4 [Chanos chanos]
MAAAINTRFMLIVLKNSVCFTQRRFRVKTKWAGTRPKFPATDLALQNFDATYSIQLGDLWPSVRAAMLSEQKYGALVNNFSSTADLITDFQSQGCIDFTGVRCSPGEQTGSQTDSALITTSKTPETEPVRPDLSSSINCFVYPRGDISRFKPARPDSNGILGYYLLDAASVLPVLALDIQQGHTALDLCAAPGGKTLALLQTQRLRFLWANDSSGSRITRLHRMLQSYIPKEYRTEDRVRITSLDGRKFSEMEDQTFDRVLVDVPCTTDRHSLMEEDNNIFKRSRTKERQRLPLLQTELLVAGIQAARLGGEVLYSTCSLSQLQNEYVVQQAVNIAQEEFGITVEIQDLLWLTHHFQETFHFAPNLSVGELVLPHLCANFGPIYMCKLRRVR